MPKFLIHIGPHKTATTYLQQRFKAMHEDLKAEGIVFPLHWAATPNNPSHLQIFNLLRDENRPDLQRELEQFRNSDCETVLISSEDLENLSAPSIELLKSSLEGHPAKFVFYCRRWSEIMPSHWQNRVKHGDDIAFPAYVARVLAENQLPVNYSIVLDRYARSFGRDAIALVGYNNVLEAGLDLAQHFVSNVLGRPQMDVSIYKSGKSNQSLSIFDTELLRTFNSMSGDGVGERARLRTRRFIARRKRLNLSRIYDAMKNYVGIVRLPETGAVLQGIHKQIAAEYGDCMLQPQSRGELFAPKQGKMQYVLPDYLLSKGIRDDLAELFREIESNAPAKDHVGNEKVH